MTDTMDEVLHAVGLGVQELRSQLAELKTKLSREEGATSIADAQLRRSQEAAAVRQETITPLHGVIAKYEAAEPAARRNLELLDRITLGLSLLIPELEAHRDNASTKAAGIAYGHVVERLLEIHTPAGHGEASA